MTPVLPLALWMSLFPIFVTPFGVAVRGKAKHKIAGIGHSVLWQP